MNWLAAAQSSSENELAVNAGSLSGLLFSIDNHMKNGEGYTIATLNLDHVVKLKSDRAFQDAYSEHTYVTADGNPIVWFSKIAGESISLIPGSDLIAPVLELAARNQIKIGLLGSTQETLDLAAQEILNKYPSIQIACKYSPEMNFDPKGSGARKAIKALKESKVELCFLALGAPKQEIFAAFAANELDSTGFLSIGAGIDFIAGSQQRAPKIVRTFAMEWLWRLASNPSRLAARYLSCFRILPSLLLQALKTRQLRQSTNSELSN